MSEPPLKRSAAPGRTRGRQDVESHRHSAQTIRPAQASGHLTEAHLDPLRVRLVDYLERTGTDLRKQGTRYLALCPIHDDSSPSLAVYGSRSSVCGCYPCGFTGDVFALAIQTGRASNFRDAVRHVAEVLGARMPVGEARESYVRPLTKRPKAPEPVVFDADRINRARLAWSDRFHSGDACAQGAMDSLGLPREAFACCAWGKCGLGWAKPSHGPEWLCYAYSTGLKWRNPDPHAKPRFQWLTGKATAPWRAEWIKPETRTVYLTEGESDCLALVAAGLEDEGNAVCVAMPGADGFAAEWAPLFTGKRVVTCFDDGHAGETATAKVAAMLKGHAAQVERWKGAARHE